MSLIFHNQLTIEFFGKVCAWSKIWEHNPHKFVVSKFEIKLEWKVIRLHSNWTRNWKIKITNNTSEDLPSRLSRVPNNVERSRQPQPSFVIRRLNPRAVVRPHTPFIPTRLSFTVRLCSFIIRRSSVVHRACVRSEYWVRTMRLNLRRIWSEWEWVCQLLLGKDLDFRLRHLGTNEWMEKRG